LQLDDKTEIVHSDMRPDGKVKVYIEKPVEGGFHCATCFVPGYQWQNIEGFSKNEINKYQEIVESVAR